METDEELFSAYLDGDGDALGGLVERYGDSLILYINAVIGDLHDSEDLMIEAFSRVCARSLHLRSGGFRPYIYRTARNLALRFISKNHAHRCFSLDDGEFEAESGELTEQAVQLMERDRTLRQCMDRLNPDYREVLYLIYFEDMSCDEAAAVMGKRNKQIENLVYRGKKALRVLLESEGIDNAQYI